MPPNDPHDRGSYVFPKDHPEEALRGRVVDHPSSLESEHHLDPEGRVVYSPAQVAAQEQARKLAAANSAEAEETLPAFATYVHPETPLAEDPPPPAEEPAEEPPAADDSATPEPVPPTPEPSDAPSEG